jgi:Mg2+ and Co2+ transporter CorA
MCKSQHTIDVKAQHARRKDTKSIKEIYAHLNLEPPRSLNAFEGEESPKIESFEEMIACFNVETSV